MPSIHQPSPYAEPNTPIASAKRPRTAVKHTGTPHKVSTSHLATEGGVGGGGGGRRGSRHAGLLQSPPPACELEQTSPDKEGHHHDDGEEARSECSGSGSASGRTSGGGEGSWKGRVVSLFSPVLKFVGGAQDQPNEDEEGPASHHHPRHQQHDMRAGGKDGEDEEEENQENDLNWENRDGGHPPPSHAHHHRKMEQEAVEETECYEDEEEEDAAQQHRMEVDEPAPEEGDEEEEGNEDEEELDVAEEFNPFLFIKQLPPYEHVAIPGKICLPQRKATRSAPASPVTLVLDLDETLVHCTVEPVPDPDVVFPVEFNGVSYQVHVRKRPHLEEFLARISKMFEVVVFTASQQVYADALLDIIDPHQKLIKHRLFRDACLPVEGNYIKDLNVLGRDISKTVLIDNSPYAYGYQLDNGIPIESWFEDREDMELLKLLPFLEELQRVDDVRPLIRSAFQSHLRVEEA